MSENMQGKVALVTGGSSGIGKASAFAFGRRGARVAIASRNAENGKLAENELRDSGVECLWIQADVSDASQVEAMVTSVIDAYGQLDYAFNNGGSGGQRRLGV